MKLTFPALFLGVNSHKIQDLISGAIQLKHFLWLRGWKTTTCKRSNDKFCTGKNPLLLSLSGMTTVVR